MYVHGPGGQHVYSYIHYKVTGWQHVRVILILQASVGCGVVHTHGRGYIFIYLNIKACKCQGMNSCVINKQCICVHTHIL